MSPKKSCFPDSSRKVSSVVPVLKNVWAASNYRLVILLSVVSKIFEKLANNKLDDSLKKLAFILIAHVLSSFLYEMSFF